MIPAAKEWLKQRWPRLSLRTYLFGSFFLVAALPGIGAVGLRVYENTLVRQTEAELVAQGAALAASAAALWPAAVPGREVRPAPPRIINPYGLAETTRVDLSATPILPERPPPLPGAPIARDALTAAARLTPVLKETRAETLASIILLDRNGTIVTGTPQDGSYARLGEVSAALAGNPGTVLRRNGAYRAVYRFDWLSRAAATRVHYARPVLVGGRVVGVLLIARSARSLFVGIYEDWGKILFGVLAILGTLAVLSGLLSRGIARPIDQLRRATQGVAAGRGDVPPTPPTAAIEIQDLYRDFTVMAEAIETRSRYLRDFAHAVSHEFKTPLAGIRGAIELLQDHGATMSPTEQRRFLANADADAARLTVLVSRLLELARADMEADGATDVADVVAIARTTVDALRSRVMAIAIDTDDPVITATVSETALGSVLTTLIENSRQGGANTVTIAIRSGSDIVITVSDNGGGIPEHDRSRVFEPFFTSRRAGGGTGLGLPIARSLLAAYGGALRLVEDHAAGAAFEIRLRGSMSSA